MLEFFDSDTLLQSAAHELIVMIIKIELVLKIFKHGLRTPNEGINQRNLKIWADVADKICFGRT